MWNYYCGYCDFVIGRVIFSIDGRLICSSRKYRNIIISIYNIDRYGGCCVSFFYSICFFYNDLKEKKI